jgi:phosphoglucomutase
MVIPDGGWLLFRKSSTERVVRLYGEASSLGRLQDIVHAGREFILNG